ncbi:helix-hairpin-helix domain-containing protein [uncultured Ilyobacter sp.]|uniref:ComEA family DNA-binding protein n=1 Tax=uncultured Ilyobacter sp. TaxID=544433 RepID=UPI0029C0AE1B|nr:helix-hairpin-helix domain-containing protein [uncultured Ilyobacter sp.]
MSENRKFLLLILLILGIFAGEKIYKNVNTEKNKQDSKYELTVTRNSYKDKNKPLDINEATVDAMLKNGISLRYAEGIDEYREITGGFQDIEELIRVKGIGAKTLEKISGKVRVYEKAKRNELYINEASDKILLYFGFTKKEIKKIRKEQKENFKINSNLQLRDILGDERYYDFKDFVHYERY